MVAPLAGAWIETLESGSGDEEIVVAPLAGAWIETVSRLKRGPEGARRPPRGGVDYQAQMNSVP